MARGAVKGSMSVDLQAIAGLLDLGGSQLLQSLLQQQARLADAEAGAVIECRADGSVGVLSYWPGMPGPGGTPPWLAASAERIAADPARQAVIPLPPSATAAELSIANDYVVTQPLKSEAARGLVVALHLRQPDDEQLAVSRERLAWSTLAFSAAEQKQARLQEAQGRQRLTAAMDVLVALHEHERFGAMVMAFCNQLAASLGAQHVAVGMVRRGGVRLAGISHSGDAGRATSLAASIERVMEEAVDQNAAVIYPPGEGATQVCRAAEEFVQAHGPRCLCTVPVDHDGEPAMVITVERAAGQPISAADHDLIQLSGDLCISRLAEAAHRDRWFGARAAVAARRGLSWLLGPQHTWAKLAGLLALAALVYFSVAKGPDQVEASFIVQPRTKRVISAPYDGLIAASEVREGDRVTGGQTVLAALDDSELRLERVAAAAEHAALLKQAEQKRADGNPTEARLASLRAESLANRVALLDQRIARSTVVAPIDGVILTGDLTRQIGAPVRQGQVLFEIAPARPVMAELRVDDSRVWQVEPGLRGQLATVSHPGHKVPFVVDRVFPMAEVMDGRNVFRVEVRLEDGAEAAAAGWLEPGVEGEARIDAGEARYIDLWTRDVINWVRMKLWL